LSCLSRMPQIHHCFSIKIKKAVPVSVQGIRDSRKKLSNDQFLCIGLLS
jgi:hypothetical protein